MQSVRKVAEELGARYVLEGSVRRAGKRIRVNAQLIEATTDTHLWAERYDRDVEDIFAVQDQVVGEIVNVLKRRLPLGEVGKVQSERPASLEAYECFLHGRDLSQRFTFEDNAKAKEWLLRARELDPNYAPAHVWLAFCHWVDWQCWSTADQDVLHAAAAAAARALELDASEPLAHAILGLTLLYARDFTNSIRQFEQALRLQPNQPDVLAFLTEPLSMDGRPLEAIRCVARAIRLNPHHPDYYSWALAFAQYSARRYEDAAVSVRRMTSAGSARRILAASLAQLGEVEDARNEAQIFLMENPRFSASEWDARSRSGATPIVSTSSRAISRPACRPEGPISALAKLERYQRGVWEQILMPGYRLPEPSLLRSHPPTEERIARLRALHGRAAEPGQPVIAQAFAQASPAGFGGPASPAGRRADAGDSP